MRGKTFVFAFFAAIHATSAWAVGPFPSSLTWPISRSSKPDLPLSSTFGPRLKASESFRYDFHRGIDIPAPYGTPVYAIAGGVVRIAGYSSTYSDQIVQIRHYKPGKTSCAYEGCFYSNSIHLSKAVVAAGQSVSQGALIGYTGASESGFPHIHFEIRDGGLYQRYNVHPLAALPYSNYAAPALRIAAVDVSDPAAVQVEVETTVSKSELDLNRIEVQAYDKTSSGEVLVSKQVFDMIELNRDYTPDSNPIPFLDQSEILGMKIMPAAMSTASESYQLKVRFKALKLNNNRSYVIRAQAVDVRGLRSSTSYSPSSYTMIQPIRLDAYKLALNPVPAPTYPLHSGIIATWFHAGEGATAANGYIPNVSSSWDNYWTSHYGGVDDPVNRIGYYPAAFVPKENPFYYALPYNDFNGDGTRRADAMSVVPWAKSKTWGAQESMLKNRWIRIVKAGVSAYAQWQDVGPNFSDDAAYVFGSAPPKNLAYSDPTHGLNGAGLDVSPAVRDFLKMSDVDKVDWQFVEESQVPSGPWKSIVTTRQVCWWPCYP